MSDATDLLKLVDSRLTRLTIKYPPAWNILWREQKHIQYALNNPSDPKVKPDAILMKARGWLTALLVEHPMFDDDFRPVVNEITDYFGDQRKI